MPSPLTINKYIQKTKRQIKQQRNKLKYSKEVKPRLDARDEIERLESKLLRFEQQLIFEQAYVQRDRNPKGDGGKPGAIDKVQECNQVGDDKPW